MSNYRRRTYNKSNIGEDSKWIILDNIKSEGLASLFASNDNRSYNHYYPVIRINKNELDDIYYPYDVRNGYGLPLVIKDYEKENSIIVVAGCMSLDPNHTTANISLYSNVLRIDVSEGEYDSYRDAEYLCRTNLLIKRGIGGMTYLGMVKGPDNIAQYYFYKCLDYNESYDGVICRFYYDDRRTEGNRYVFEHLGVINVNVGNSTGNLAVYINPSDNGVYLINSSWNSHSGTYLNLYKLGDKFYEIKQGTNDGNVLRIFESVVSGAYFSSNLIRDLSFIMHKYNEPPILMYKLYSNIILKPVNIGTDGHSISVGDDIINEYSGDNKNYAKGYWGGLVDDSGRIYRESESVIYGFSAGSDVTAFFITGLCGNTTSSEPEYHYEKVDLTSTESDPHLLSSDVYLSQLYEPYDINEGLTSSYTSPLPLRYYIVGNDSYSHVYREFALATYKYSTGESLSVTSTNYDISKKNVVKMK